MKIFGELVSGNALCNQAEFCSLIHMLDCGFPLLSKSPRASRYSETYHLYTLIRLHLRIGTEFRSTVARPDKFDQFKTLQEFQTPQIILLITTDRLEILRELCH